MITGMKKFNRRSSLLYAKFFHRIRKDYRITAWKYINVARFLRFFFSRHFEIANCIVLVFSAFFLASLIVHSVDIASISTSSFSTLFMCIGAMIGGIIAVVFTLSLFAQQNAADLYTSQYFE